MRAIFSIVFLLTSILVTAQTGTIKGRVIDSKTFKPLPFTTVYINNTTYGSITNDDGDFQLKALPPGTHELVVSYVGYQSYQTRLALADSATVSVSIKLISSPLNLKEVQVNAKRDVVWNQQYEKFRRLFFGVSPYEPMCTIANPWVLEFKTDANGLLTAEAALPLEIENLGMGYKIVYQLKDFVVGPSTYKINGNVRFEPIATVDSTLAKLWNQRRKDAYLGSVRHLFKSILENKTMENGFDLYLDKSNLPDVVRNSNFLTNMDVSITRYTTNDKMVPSLTPGVFKEQFPKRLEVHYLKRSTQPKIYRNVTHPVSWIEVTGGVLEFNKDGIVLNPQRMTVAGAMGDPRIAEILPYDFKPQENKHEQHVVADATAKHTVLSPLAALVEKIYLQTDKPYYYPTDLILFKGYVNYLNPLIRDSLSHVLHVELLDPRSKVFLSKLFPIVDGMATGDLQLPNTVQKGNYTLRAYTNWSLNFNENFIFSKPVIVMGSKELAKTATQPEPANDHINIRTEKSTYHPRERITLAIEATDFYNYGIESNLSVSVTDLEQSIVPSNEMTILNQFPIQHNLLPDTSLRVPQYKIQYGIDFKGTFLTKKKKVKKGILTVFQENSKDVFAIPTDEQGKFHRQLQLMDSTELYIQARGTEGKAGRVIMDTIKSISPAIPPPLPLALTVYVPGDPSLYHVTDPFSTAKMLEAVVIESKRIEKASAARKFLDSDYKVDGNWLRSTFATDLLSAIQSRVPGLKILYYRDSNGLIRKYLVFNSMISFSTNAIQECLVEIDGVPLYTMESSAAEQLSYMHVSEIENIEVMKNGSAAAFGARGANGVIAVTTKKGGVEQAPPPFDKSKLQTVKMPGYAAVTDFESPDYSATISGDDRLDSRSTIYWNPSVKTVAEEPSLISFYAADFATTYRIVVEGVTAEGKPVRGEKLLTIEKP